MTALSIRERIEAFEEQMLSSYAVKSRNSRGRDVSEEPCTIRTHFQRDRDRIIHCKAFRRLKDKTQVFIIPEGDHYRTRLTHTLEVSQISRTIARGLRLNEDLTEAICMGHDLGHTPFGHAGEEVLNRIHPGGFRHNVQSVRVVEILERNGKGLNLTWEVRDGILNHTGKDDASTLEGQIVKTADRIAYINHDIDDAIRGNVLKAEDLPKPCLEVLGYTHGERIHTMVADMIEASTNQPKIQQSKGILDAMNELRGFMFKNVYLDSVAKEEEVKARYIVEYIYNYFVNYPEQLPSHGVNVETETELIDEVKDFVAGMTDRFIIKLFQKMMIPKPWVSI